jgi:hypothetical protein
LLVADVAGQRRVFSLNEARELLPAVRKVTADAVHRAEVLADAIEGLEDDAPERSTLGADLKIVVDGWAGRIQEMGLEAKGLWLVDFDNGEGYYCWRYPEESLSHYHGYDEGFAGRMKIM